MEFLRYVFDEEIEVGGPIEICGVSFSKSRIVKELEPMTYDMAFNEWFEDRKSRLLEKADSILEMYDNKDRFNQLKDIYKRDAVIPFIGAGFTIESGYPGWTDFLYYLQKNSKVEKEIIDQYVIEGKYEEAAQLLYDALTPPTFNDMLANKYGISNNLKGPICYLPKLFDSAVITTNFDPVLKTLYEDASLAFKETLFGCDADEFPQLYGRGERVLLKLHGDTRERRRILTLQEYTRAYENANTIRTLIEDVLFMKTLLFIGCSLNVDRTMKAMADYVSKRGYDRCTKHYCFISCKNNNDRFEIRDRIAKSNIYPIFYNDGDHSDSIEALFFKLME